MADTSLVFDILARDKTSAGLSSARKRAMVAFAAIGAAALGYGVMAGKAAAADQQSAAVLAQTLKNATGARDADVSSVEDWIASLTLATGVADDQLRPALANLARGTGDVSKAQDQLKVAMDVAAATGKPLEAVTLAMMKAQQGNVGALGRLGIATKDAGGKTKTFAGIYADMTDKFGGSQAAKTASAAGQMQVMQNALDETTESVGYGLLPIVTTLATFLAQNLLPPIKSVTDWMSQNSNATKILGAVLLVCAAGVLATSGAMKVAGAVSAAWKAATVIAAGAQWLLNAALTANPIGIVVVAIAALVGALVLLYQKNETVRKIVDAVWSGIKTAIGAVVGWFQNTAWPVIKTVASAIGNYYRWLWGVVSNVWNNVKGAIGAVVGWFQSTAWPKIKAVVDFIGNYYKALFLVVKTVWDKIKGAIGAVVGWFRDTAWPKIKVVADLIGGIWSGIANAAKTAFNLIARAWNNTVGKLSFSTPDIPGTDWGGISIDVPDIPYLAKGGIVTRPTLAMIGEAGPEAVVPLGRGGGVGGVHFHFNGPIDPVAAGREIDKVMSKYVQGGGTLGSWTAA